MDGVRAVVVGDDGWRLGHRPGLDGLRGVAIVLVLLLHWWPATFPGGNDGVNLFFVLSGFLITRLLLEERWRTGRISLRSFYVRRLRRLMPASLALTVLFITAPGALWVLVYGANWARNDGVLVGGPLEHVWSLAIEEQFYALWPVVLAVALVRCRLAWAFTLLVAALVALHRVELDETMVRETVGTDTRFDSLLIGCSVALAAGVLVRWSWQRAAQAVAVPLLWVLVAGPDMTGFGFTLSALAWAGVLLWAVGSHGWITVSSLRWMGRLSYSLYLWHYPVTWALRGGDIHATAWWSTALAIPLSFGMAWISYRFVEERFRSRTPSTTAARTAVSSIRRSG